MKVGLPKLSPSKLYDAVHQACLMACCQVLDKPSVDATASEQEVYQAPGELPNMAGRPNSW